MSSTHLFSEELGMKDLNVLVTAAGNVFMPGTLACLKKNGERNIRVIGADMSEDPTILQMCDAAYQVPKCGDPSYIDSLLDICKIEKVDILLPIMSAELEALCDNRRRFEEAGTIVSVSDKNALHIANNKQHLLQYLNDSGLPCARYASVTNSNELKQCAERLGYPENMVCVKTAEGSGSRGFRILSEMYSKYHIFMNEKPSSGMITLDEMLEILNGQEDFPELLVMEYLPGAEYSVDLVADHGKVLAIGCRKSLRMENSIMLEAEIVQNEAVEALCTVVTEGLGLDGNIGFDLREREDGTPIVMECNPRITAGIPYFMLAGVNMPYLCVKKILGESISQAVPEYGKIIRRRWMEMAY